MNETAQIQSEESAIETVDQSATEEQDEKIFVKRSAEELAKRLKETSQEAKLNRQKVAELKKQLEDKQKQELASGGNYKELAEIWQRKATDSETQANKLKNIFAVKTIADTVSLEAATMGCIDVDALVNLIPLDQVPIDETFNVDRASVKAMLEDFRKTKPYFFKKQAPRIADAVPGKPAPAGKPLEKMSAKEIEEILKTKFSK